MLEKERTWFVRGVTDIPKLELELNKLELELKILEAEDRIANPLRSSLKTPPGHSRCGQVAAKSGSTLSAGIAMSLKESSNETTKQEMKVMNLW